MLDNEIENMVKHKFMVQMLRYEKFRNLEHVVDIPSFVLYVAGQRGNVNTGVALSRYVQVHAFELGIFQQEVLDRLKVELRGLRSNFCFENSEFLQKLLNVSVQKTVV